MLSLAKFAMALILLTAVGKGAVFSSTTELRSKYDFVVVGGGTAGLVVANRLTEERYTVLVLEAGGDHSQDINITVPFFNTRTWPDTIYDWNLTTIPQSNANDRVIDYPRGFMLGGSSSINQMAYTRGTREDYDGFASLSGDEGWSWDAMRRYMFKNEKLTSPTDNDDTTGELDPRAHSIYGMNPDSLPGFAQRLNDMIVHSTKELPEEFPYNMEPNGGFHLGIGWKLSTIFNGRRSSSATSYLAPHFNSRPNLDVLVGARATRVLPESNSGNGTSYDFLTVEFVCEGQYKEIAATKEIILSAGSIHTPTILQHSGIGNTTYLSSLNITPRVNLPSVGQNLTDHPSVPSIWLVNANDTLDQYTRNVTKMAEALGEWEERKGPLVLDRTAARGS